MSVQENGLFTFKVIQSTCPIIPDNKFKPNKVIHEWLYQGVATGDGSGGVIQFELDFGTYFDKNHYIVISFISYICTNGSMTGKLLTETDRWDNLYTPNITDQVINLWAADGLAYSYQQRDAINKPIYLGRPRIKDSDPGLCRMQLATNTNAYNYACLLSGYTLERPLPFTSILQP